jgi:hypothetical protein
MDPLTEFEKIVDYIFGVYLDATTGFERLRTWFKENQGKSLEMLKESHPEFAGMEYLDTVSFTYGVGDPGAPGAIVLHKCTQREYKERNTEKGINYKFIGNMSLVSLYQYWEDHYRAKVAENLSLQKNKLKEPVMGDIRRLRISIIHHSGIALKEIEKCELLKWLKEGDEIFIDKEKFVEIVFYVKTMINELRKQQIHQLSEVKKSFDVTQDPVFQMEGYDSNAPSDLSCNIDKYIYENSYTK